MHPTTHSTFRRPFHGFLLAAMALFTLAGCDTKGTCITDEESSFGGFCHLNYRKSECASVSGKFFDENSTAGLLHCKMAGFDRYVAGGSSKSAEQALKDGDMVTYATPLGFKRPEAPGVGVQVAPAK